MLHGSDLQWFRSPCQFTSALCEIGMSGLPSHLIFAGVCLGFVLSAAASVPLSSLRIWQATRVQLRPLQRRPPQAGWQWQMQKHACNPCCLIRAIHDRAAAQRTDKWEHKWAQPPAPPHNTYGVVQPRVEFFLRSDDVLKDIPALQFRERVFSAKLYETTLM